MQTQETIPEKKGKLIQAAVGLMLRQGYAGTSVDEICAAAGVTKGSFFHYFSSKEDICIAAMDAWAGGWTCILEDAKFDQIPDPFDRVQKLFQIMEHAYLTQPEPGCLVGTVAQELSLPNEKFRVACEAHLEVWKVATTKLLADAKAAHPPKTDFDPEEVAWWLCSYVQGTLLIAKTRPDRAIVTSNIRHCRAYVNGLFGK